eukprot:TRINITY_DN93164_c0_g1_i1.p1 TRINITY_DN93164_c0_g1~~TRINITY_DN93164_c0_g1_i1.p1  ORF type:complete len:501 (+),score=105.36 TRINITY_DN93164_c0_g1_i1:124-1626(+)
MVKNRKIWKQIQDQYAKLQEDEIGAEHLAPCVASASSEALAAQAVTAHSDVALTATPGQSDVPSFYRGGFQQKHWVLTCCSLMIMCEWIDRGVLSIAMQSMKEDFGLNDTQAGLIASASLWVVPLATGPLGRLADLVPRAKLLGAGVFLWAACTFATGSAQTFSFVILCRLVGGVANCAGYPVAVSFLSDHFKPEELSTAMGYTGAGAALGGLLGFAAGGTLISLCGWRWAFWAVASPQVVVSLLFLCTLPESKSTTKPERAWCLDLCELLSLKSLRFLMLVWLLTGLLSGQGRFLSPLVQRKYGVEPAQIGLVMGPILGVTGLLGNFFGSHLVDHCYHKFHDARINLWLAAFSDLLHLLLGVAAVLAPNFSLLVFFTALATVASSLRQGVQTAVQSLSTGRRATTQSVLELCWAVGMGLGPLLAGYISDAIDAASEECDEACSLTRSLLVFGSCGLGVRLVAYLGASRYIRREALDQADVAGEPCRPAADTLGRGQDLQ